MDARRRHQGQQQQQQQPLSATQQYYHWATQQQYYHHQLQQQQHQQQRQRQPLQNPYRPSQPPPHQYQQQQQQQQQQQNQYQQQQKSTIPPSCAWQQASRLQHHGDEDANHHQQSRSGDDISPILLIETAAAVTCPVQGCHQRLVPDFTQASFGFVLDEDVDQVLTSPKGERKRLLVKFLRMVNALLNQGGGLVFIHTSPHLLSFWDEQVDDDLMDLVSDDTLFDDNFERHVAKGHVIFRVKPLHRPYLSTLDFQSKISLNKGLADPSHGQMRRLLDRNRNAPDETPPSPRGTLDSYLLVDGQRIPFHENLNMQAKVVLPKDLDKKTPKSCKDTASKLTFLWWNSLKLPQYLAAFAKQRNGGSFFLGLREEKETSSTKWKPLPNTSGLAEALDTDMRFWADDKNTEERKVFHVAREEDVPRFEHKSGYFTCKGIPLTHDDKNALEKLVVRNVRDRLLLHPERSKDPLVEVRFYPVKPAQEDNRDTDERHPQGARGGGGGVGGSAKGQGHGLDNKTATKTTSLQSADLYVVECKVNFFPGVCFQTEHGPEAYRFNHDLRPSCAQRVPVTDWAKAQA
ncbi:uncharacterized protein LOC143286953 [Babylonia areolata]|uniref:uncharacterized protein LOC143286953 n=1 Tax=Babylonia areolata TaxID=304850 RepID=UPI003FD12EF6